MSKINIPQELTLKQIETYMSIPFVKELCIFIEETYNAKPKFEYSECSMKPGWNVKYKKGNKAICVIYPEKKYFTCLVTVKGGKEVEGLINKCDSYTKKTYKNTSYFNQTKWLMLDVKNKQILSDIKKIIDFKMSKSVN